MAPEAAALLPTVFVLVAVIALSWRERGSVAAGDWMGWLIGIAVLVAVLALLARAAPPSRLALLGAGALVAFAAWAALSALWSPFPGLARDEALLRLLYAAAFLVPVLSLRSPADRLNAVAAVVLAVGGLSAAAALKIVLADDPLPLYFEGRVYFPLTYANAQAALLSAPFWPAIAIAARRRASPALRAPALAAAVACLGGALMAQSKGWVVGLVASTLVFFAICPLRVRCLLPAALAVGLVAAGASRLTAPYSAEEERLRATIDDAAAALLLLTAAALVVGLVYALADRRIDVRPRAARLARMAVATLAAAAAIAAVGGFLVTVDDPVGFVQDKWEEAKKPSDVPAAGTHFTELGSRRYDFWRVAVSSFRDEPVAGIGARGFQWAYLRDGTTYEEPARAHSLFFDVLAEEGAVGVLLLAAVLVCTLGAALARGRRAAGAAALAAAGVYLFAHSTVDWIWTFPAVGIVFFTLVGIAAAESLNPLSRRLSLVVGSAALAVAVLAIPPWATARLTERALRQPETAGRDLRWARRLDPLSPTPIVIEAELATDPAVRIDAWRRAVDREPRRFALRYRLGLAYLDAGQVDAARGALEEARKLAPRNDFVAEAIRRAG